MKLYEAILLSYDASGGYEDPSMQGFKTEEEAWEYVKDHLCYICEKDEEPLASRCAAEWMVEEYEI